MIKIAFIHFNGLGIGGTERFLQTVAAHLPSEEFLVDYYYSGIVSVDRKKYMEDRNINLIHFEFEQRIEKAGYTYFSKCNLEHVFKYDYDIIQTGKYGSAESIFEFIKDIPIIDSIHYVSGYDNQFNISRVMHISEFSKNEWIKKGGDKKRIVMISHPIRLPKYQKINIRKRYNISDECILFGMHQRKDDEIFSEMILDAYSRIESEKNAIIICGGSEKYRYQAEALGIKRCYFIDATSDNDVLFSFLESLDIYVHGRKDGELNSIAIAEALIFGLPIITHPSKAYNGHLEIINQVGIISKDVEEYKNAMERLQDDITLRKELSKKSFEKFKEKYDFNIQLNNIIDIYKETITNPYPNKSRRYCYNIKQIVLNFMKRVYINFFMI